MTTQTPKDSPLIGLIRSKTSEMEKYFSGFTDSHLKTIDFIIKNDFKVDNCKYDLFIEENPKRVLIRVFSSDGKEIYITPKSLTYLEKMIQYLGLTNWVIQFNKKGDL